MSAPVSISKSVYVAALGQVLLGLGCLAQDIYDFATIDYSSSEDVASASVNSGADLGAFALIIRRAQNYYSIAQGLIMETADEILVIVEDFEDVFKAGSPVFYALSLVEAVKLTTGFGQPYGGGSFNAGSDQLTALYEQLALAVPDDSWTGPAADIYRAELGALRDAISRKSYLRSELGAAEQDKILGSAAQDAAEIISHLRLALGILTGLLTLAGIIEEVICLQAEEIDEIPWTVFMVKAAAGLGVTALAAVCANAWNASVQVHDSKSRKPQNLAHRVSKDYEHLAGDVVYRGVNGSALVGVAAAQESRVSGFADILASTSVPAALSVPAAPAAMVSAPAELATVSGPGVPPGSYPFSNLWLANQAPAPRSAPAVPSNRRSGTPAPWPAVEEIAPAEVAPAADGDTRATGERAPIEVAAVSVERGDSRWKI